ncbi:hypothetical protein ACFV1L_32065 [Kitasatospora sp. NPDC059646]|uniref:hypothetical protein n=1 Tax=Kitasatospora sp. NPDC059646 TaxID=3346893 RepID=UPI00368C7A34
MEQANTGARRVPGAARALAALATACTGPALVWWFGNVRVFWQPLLVGAVLTLLPQVARRARAFRVICWTVVGLLLVVQPPGIWFGLFLLLPAGLMLATAGARANSEGSAATVLLAALALAGSCAVLFA